jgi:hypothetical protein
MSERRRQQGDPASARPSGTRADGGASRRGASTPPATLPARARATSDQAAPDAWDPRELLALQRSAGNHAVGALLDPDAPALGAAGTTAVEERVGVQRREDEPTGAFLEANFGPVNEMGIVYQETGANLRSKPVPEAEGSQTLAHLPQNAKVFILGHDPTSRWLAVTTADGKGGRLGYIADWLVWRHLPDPESNVTKVGSGDYPLLIAARHYSGKGFNMWGEDLRYVVNALVYANVNTVHNGTGQPGLRKVNDDVTQKWFHSKATADVYIWLPSPQFLRSMYETVAEKGGGTGSITADLWRAAKEGLEVLAYGAAFIGGLVHGFGKSIYDAGKAIVDLLISIFTGEVINDAKEIWDAISNLSWDDIREAVGDWALEWGRKLESRNPFTAGHAHGYLTGYVMGEAAMLLLSGGTLAALKGAAWAGRLGQALKGLKALERLSRGISKARRVGGEALEQAGRRAKAVLKIRPGDVRSLLRRHIKARDPSVPRKNGIGGAHDMTEFAKHAGEYTVVSRTPHPSIPGVHKIEYRMQALDMTGKPTGAFQKKVLTKTVYDPAVWIEDKLVNTVVEAARDAVTNGTFTREWTGVSKAGVRIRGYQDNGKITSFFFD